ncbi:MAG: AsmA family protein [Sulfurospirillaceae bacterium]|nr:AsmA family protein [Sulfurospirillaceae bacterium]
MFQKIVLSVVLFCALSVVSFFLIIKVIDFNEYKPKIQKAIKESTGYDLSIQGDIVLSLSPVGVSISDIQVSNPYYKEDIPFVKLGNFDVAVEIAPLFHKEVKVKHIALENLYVLVEKTKEGKYNFEIPSSKVSEKTKQEDKSLAVEESEVIYPLVNVTQIKFGDAHLEYKDEKSGKIINADKINLNVNDINYDPSKNKLYSVIFKANAKVGNIQYDAINVKDIEMVFDMKEAIANLESLKYTIFDSVMNGSAKVDISGKLPKVLLKNKIVDLKLDQVSNYFLGSEIIKGVANGDLKFAFSLGDVRTIKSTLNGTLQLSGENIEVKGYDIEKILAIANNTKITPNSLNFASLLIGPWDAFKGKDSLVKQINTTLDIGYSEVQLSDVALSIAKSRIAIKGALQMIEEKFLDVKVALLDAKGCSTFEQTLTGTFSKPMVKLDAVSVKTLATVALSLVKNPKNDEPVQVQVPNDNCVPFYEGVVKQP